MSRSLLESLPALATAFEAMVVHIRNNEVRIANDFIRTVIQDPTANAPPYSPPKPPEHWEKVEQPYRYKNQIKQAELYIARTADAKGVILLALGWKSPAAAHTKTVSMLQSQGYTVVVMPLIDPGNKPGSLPESTLRMQKVLFDSNSILYQEARKTNAPVFSLTHSTHGNLYRRVLQNVTDQGYEIPDNLLGVIHMNPFFAPATASPESPLSEKLYFDWWVKNHPDQNTIESMFGRAYHHLNGEGHKVHTGHRDMFPTQIQVAEIRGEGLKSIHDKSSRIPHSPPEIFAVTDNDIYSCTPSAIKIAHRIGAEILNFPTGGHQVEQLPEFMDRLAQRLDQQTQDWHSRIEDVSFNYDVSPLLTIPPAFEP